MQKFLILLCSLALAGCGGMESGQGHAGAAPDSSAVRTESSPGALRPLGVFDSSSAPPATFAFTQVTPRRADLHAAAPEAELAPPEPHRDALPVAALEIDEDLRAPILRDTVRVDAVRARRGWVELDVRVDEEGAVSDALFAAGQADSSAVEAAIEAARAMRYWPAVRSGRAVAVWCRQRFEFGR